MHAAAAIYREADPGKHLARRLPGNRVRDEAFRVLAGRGRGERAEVDGFSGDSGRELPVRLQAGPGVGDDQALAPHVPGTLRDRLRAGSALACLHAGDAAEPGELDVV